MKKTSDIYKKLYHYTTWEGLQCILHSQSLWATHYSFLNDYMEVVLFRDKLISLLYRHVRIALEELVTESQDVSEYVRQYGGVVQAARHLAVVLVDAQYSATSREIYILSFCGEPESLDVKENGLLSQWRGYGAGGGCALVFDTEALESLLMQESKLFQYDAGYLSNVVYDGDETRIDEELEEELNILTEGAKSIIRSLMLDEEDPPALLESFRPFVSCITRFKHAGFREENEVRVVALPSILNQRYVDMAKSKGVTPKPEKQRKFRDSGDRHIPYIELFETIENGLPIEKIIVGPHRNSEHRAAALRVKLRNTDVAVHCSDIPYIE